MATIPPPSLSTPPSGLASPSTRPSGSLGAAQTRDASRHHTRTRAPSRRWVRHRHPHFPLRPAASHHHPPASAPTVETITDSTARIRAGVLPAQSHVRREFPNSAPATFQLATSLTAADTFEDGTPA